MSTRQLLQLGWAITRTPNTPTTIHTAVHNWDSLTWAHRTALKAALGTDDNGDLAIPTPILLTTAALRTITNCSPQPNGFPLPHGSLPGVDQRLKDLLIQERTDVQPVDHDPTGLLHTGPDGSCIFTSEEYWGPLDNGYPELKERDFKSWDTVSYGTSQAPCWACPPCNGFN